MIESKENVPMIEEDEIDLRELWKTIVKGKKVIAIIVAVITSITLVMMLAKPNMYKSETILVSQGSDGASKSLGGLGALAGLAGVSLGGGGSDMAPTAYLQTILDDYAFNKMVIEKYKIDELFKKESEKLEFALGFSGFYSLFNSTKESEDEPVDHVALISDIKNKIKIAEDAKKGTVTISVESMNRSLAKELLDIYLVELTSYYRTMDMQEVDKKLDYYESELASTQDIQLKTELSQLISALMQKKVLARASKYYMFKQITQPRVAEVKEKTGPKRGLVIVVAFVTSIILAIFLVFLLEFIQKNRDENPVE